MTRGCLGGYVTYEMIEWVRALIRLGKQVGREEENRTALKSLFAVKKRPTRRTRYDVPVQQKQKVAFCVGMYIRSTYLLFDVPVFVLF